MPALIFSSRLLSDSNNFKYILAQMRVRIYTIETLLFCDSSGISRLAATELAASKCLLEKQSNPKNKPRIWIIIKKMWWKFWIRCEILDYNPPK